MGSREANTTASSAGKQPLLQSMASMAFAAATDRGRCYGVLAAAATEHSQPATAQTVVGTRGVRQIEPGSELTFTQLWSVERNAYYWQNMTTGDTEWEDDYEDAARANTRAPSPAQRHTHDEIDTK